MKIVSSNWHVVLAPLDNGWTRAAVVSRLPVAGVQLASNSSRVAAALTEVHCGSAFYKFLFLSFYGKAGDREGTRDLLRGAREDVVPYGLPFVLAGDFQYQTTESPIATALSQGHHLFELDDCRQSPPPPTGPGNTRVIDYALASPQITATRALTFAGTADHSGVYYDIGSFGTLPPLLPPRFGAVVHNTEAEVHAAFLTESFDGAFAGAHSVDQKWAVLASYADHALTNKDPESSVRHLPWEPKRRERVQHKAAKASEPLDIRRLRRLLRRLRHASLRGCTEALGKVIRRDFLQLGCDFPALSRVSSDPVTLLMLPCRLLRFSAPVKRSFATLASKRGSSPPRRTLLSNASGSRAARSSSLLGLLLL